MRVRTRFGWVEGARRRVAGAVYSDSWVAVYKGGLCTFVASGAMGRTSVFAQTGPERVLGFCREMRGRLQSVIIHRVLSHHEIDTMWPRQHGSRPLSWPP